MSPDAVQPLTVLGSLLFSLMGPIAAIPTFAAATAGADRPLQLKIAFLSAGLALLAIVIAVFAGATAMASAGTSQSSLIMAAGLLLVLSALRNIFGGQPGAHGAKAEPNLGLALSPIAIPGLVTPVGVAVLILFVSYFPDHRLQIMGIVSVLMSFNLLAMLGAEWFMRWIGPGPLVVLGAVFGVLQVAMGIEMLVSGVLRSKLLG